MQVQVIRYYLAIFHYIPKICDFFFMFRGIIGMVLKRQSYSQLIIDTKQLEISAKESIQNIQDYLTKLSQQSLYQNIHLDLQSIQQQLQVFQ